MDDFFFILNEIKNKHLDFLQNNIDYYERMKKEILEIKRLGQIINIKQSIEIKKIIESFNVPFFIRGSAGGSLVLYLLGFTDIDPVKHNIVFERFINENRTTLGDIDFDLPRSKRDEILKKVYNYYSSKNIRIGRIINRVYYRMNSAIRESVRRVSKYGHIIPKNIIRDSELLKEFFRENHIDQKRVIEVAAKLLDKQRYISPHVGGIVFLKDDEEYIDNKKPEIIPLVNLDRKDIDNQKRFKVDLLSNTGLDIINDVYPNTDLSEKSFPYRQEVFDIFGNGDIIGIVFGESPLIKSVFQQYHKHHTIKSIEDIANCLALIRPMARNQDRNTYKNQVKNTDKNQVKNTDKNQVKNTDKNQFTDLIYDDDWIVELSKLLNISYSEADKQRKLLAKDDPSLKYKLLDIVSPKRLTQLMQIKNYGFCKAHAMNYARLLYCQAYAKWERPLDFYCSVLNSLDERIYADWVYFHEIVNKNIKIYAHKRRDKYIVKKNMIIPKNGIQTKIIPLDILQEIDEFGGITTLKNIEKLDGLEACSRKHKNKDGSIIVFKTILRNNILTDVIEED